MLCPLATIQAQSSPTINALKPSPGLISIYGSGFGTTAGTVTVGGGLTPIQSWTDTSILVAFTGTNSETTEVVVVFTSRGAKDKSVISLHPAVLGSAATDRDNAAYINGVSINDGFNQTHIAPGSTFTVGFHYATVCSGGSCPIAVQVGLDVGAPGACFYAENQGSKQVTLTAPTTPGIYYVVFDRNQNYCQAIWDYGTPPLTQSIGSIIVY